MTSVEENKRLLVRKKLNSDLHKIIEWVSDLPDADSMSQDQVSKRCDNLENKIEKMFLKCDMSLFKKPTNDECEKYFVAFIAGHMKRYDIATKTDILKDIPFNLIPAHIFRSINMSSLFDQKKAKWRYHYSAAFIGRSLATLTDYSAKNMDRLRKK